MNAIHLRQATEEDAASIVSVLHASYEEYRAILRPPSGVHKESVESVRAKMKMGQWLIAEDGATQHAVGCVYYEPRGDFMYLGRLAVLRAFRGRGIATALIARVEMLAQAEGFTRVRLGVRVVLPALRAMYERHGYYLIESRSHEGFSEPTYLMLEKEIFSSKRPCCGE